ncbi:nuclear transport factor 2 family protein [Pandoraea nosoerga]|uniref:SnoaL-like domain-containing protein n=1 Tax=Pandoraea nosoerga TaxID=2508296 RepID=A0A5E4U653_9BURK|nr:MULTISPECIES: nuclear transport factor 2 family protein [Pandoraea]MBN4667602.1 nuclear transport factor 2 family protein [Pandoraea nosoerga]MBN4676722.1 nuclear transport factor 2 family protein [Pandoraea nosoerga]MBN4683255.1 nuclear transport factor 2 family protein [Pandoraea nosoerga]MBN4746714.1 nuclear transport factor 2 family protein [Pandoraea nosoerga]VVD95530.1 hypothetical protein PNO31109_01840 [Pandoraea nosoerga]
MVETYPAHGDEAAIRAIQSAWLDAVRTKQVGTLLDHYDPEVVVFDVMPPTEHRGHDAYRRLLEGWFGHTVGPIHFEVTQWHLECAGELAFSHSVNVVRNTGPDGQTHGATVRATVAYRKSQGRWRVVHEHASVPMMFAP